MPLPLSQGRKNAWLPPALPGGQAPICHRRRGQGVAAMAWRIALQTQETLMSQFFSLVFQTVEGKETDSCWPWTGCSEVASGGWEPERSQLSLKFLGTSSFNVGNCLKQQRSLQIWVQPASSFSRIAPICTTMGDFCSFQFQIWT